FGPRERLGQVEAALPIDRRVHAGRLREHFAGARGERRKLQTEIAARERLPGEELALRTFEAHIAQRRRSLVAPWLAEAQLSVRGERARGDTRAAHPRLGERK